MVTKLSSKSRKHSRQFKQSMQAKSEILAAFMDAHGNYVKRTWNELYEKSRLSKGRFSIHFRELLANGLVKGEVVIDPKTKRMLNIFEYTKLPLINVSATNEAIRVVSAIDEKGRKTPILEKTEW